MFALKMQIVQKQFVQQGEAFELVTNFWAKLSFISTSENYMIH